MPARLRLTPPRTRWWDLWPLVLADCGGDAPVVLQGCERLGSLCTAEAESQSLDVVGSRGVTADLDGDGIRDLVSTGSGLSITWSRSDHREYLLFPGGVPDAEIGDVDSDGDLDVVFITGEPSTLRVLANEGTRRLVEQPAVMLPGRAHGLWIGQLDGDETLDAVVASGAPGGKGELTVFTAGLTRRETITVGHKPIAVEAADLDGDGRLDLVAADFDESVLHIVLANGAGFAPPRQVPTGPAPTYLQLYDLDGDGHDDIAVHSGTLEGVVLVWGDPERTPTVTTIPVSVAASSHLAVADLDGDGAPQLLVGTMQGVLQIAFTGRDPGRPQTVLRRSADRGLLAADLDADGNTDIVAASDEGVDILLRSPDFLTEPLGLWLPRPRAVDLDGDQILDLIGVGGAAVMTYRSGQPAAPQPDDSVSP